MQLLALHITRDDEPTHDDVITFQTNPLTPDMVEVVSKFKDVRYHYRCTLPRSRCAAYARTVIRSLSEDAEPFDRVQVNSALFPAAMFEVSSLWRASVSDAIDDMLYVTFDTVVRRTVA